MNRAILGALIAGACWGVSFLAPRALPGESPTTLALFRFIFFGISSGGYLLFRGRKIPPLDRDALVHAFYLSMAGFSLYYALLSLGVQGIGVSFATALIALLPLTILLVSLPTKKWKMLTLPLFLIGVGGVAVPIGLFFNADQNLPSVSIFVRVGGLAATLGALGLWTAFAILNARFLKRRKEWLPLEWGSVLGVGAAGTALIIFFLKEGKEAFSVLSESITHLELLGWTAFMGIAGGWLASALWNLASRTLSTGALGMLLVFESIFGLVFGFLYERRGPSALEVFAVLGLIGGAVLGLIGGAVLGIQRLSLLKSEDRFKPSDKPSDARNGVER